MKFKDGYNCIHIFMLLCSNLIKLRLGKGITCVIYPRHPIVLGVKGEDLSMCIGYNKMYFRKKNCKMITWKNIHLYDLSVILTLRWKYIPCTF